MKANRKVARFEDDESAVSPVIAVILMVAITVVLAATVFVMVSNIGKNVGTVGPQAQLVPGPQTSSTQWIVRVATVSVKHPVSDYQLILTDPSLTKVLVDPVGGGGNVQTWYATIVTGSIVNSQPGAPAANATSASYRIVLKDVSNDQRFSTGDEIEVKYSAAGNAYTSPFPTGDWLLEVRHKSSDSIAGTLTRTT